MDLVYRPQVPKPGLGNLIMNLCMCKFSNVAYIHKDIFDYEFGNCFILRDFMIVGFDGQQPDCSCYINDFTIENVWPKCRDFLRPTPHLMMMSINNRHLVENVILGVNIRRGNYSPDSVQFKGSTDKKYYFCSDAGLLRFMQCINNAPGRVYVTSDSASTKKMIKKQFGDKVTMLETVYTHTAEQSDESTQTVKNLQDVYLSWFLLSQCPRIVCTGGEKDLVGFSTFGFMAAMYGDKPWMPLFNED